MEKFAKGNEAGERMRPEQDYISMYICRNAERRKTRKGKEKGKNRN